MIEKTTIDGTSDLDAETMEALMATARDRGGLLGAMVTSLVTEVRRRRDEVAGLRRTIDQLRAGESLKIQPSEVIALRPLWQLARSRIADLNRTIEQAGYCDNYTDAARARDGKAKLEGSLAVFDRLAEALLQQPDATDPVADPDPSWEPPIVQPTA